MGDRDRVNKAVVVIPPGAEFEGGKDFYESAEDAGWSDDPGTGKAILALDERGAPGYEVLNSVPMAPPIGYEPSDSIDVMIQKRLAKYFAEGDSTVLDESEEEANDFDVPDDLPDLRTIYEVVEMIPEAPSVRDTMTEAVSAALERERKRAAEPPVVDEGKGA